MCDVTFFTKAACCHAVMDVCEAESESYCRGETGCSIQALVQPSSATAERIVFFTFSGNQLRM